VAVPRLKPAVRWVLGVAKTPTKKGATGTITYQKCMPKKGSRRGLAVPDEVTIAMGEIADDLREGLLALAVGAGLEVMGSLTGADVAAVCGPRGRYDPERTVVRHGSVRGSVTLGGRRTGVTRPRMRATSGGGEVPVPAYELFSSSEILRRMAMGKMLGGLSSRRYRVGLEPVGENVERAASATSKSAVSRAPDMAIAVRSPEDG
jgi:putative transposase